MTGTTITELVVARLRARSAVAVRAGGTDLSSGDLDAWSGSIAAWLTARGIGRGHVVPVVAARGGALVAGCLGVLRSGAAFAPLSLDTPQNRLRHIVRELDAGAILADEAARPLLGPIGSDGDGVAAPPLAGLRHGRAAPQVPANEPDDPAVVIYTSGTTGRPKGVLIPHRGLLNTALWWAADTDLRPGDRVLCTWSTAFDGATFEAFRTLVSGAVLVYADDEQRRDPRALAALLRGPDAATVTSMTPSLARAILESDPGGPTGLRVAYLGGEPVTRQLARDCAAAWGAEIRNIYGPTEASCISTSAPVDPGEERPPIGVPLPNTRAYVLGPHGEELPRGVPGELYVAGAGVALGYFGQPELTRTAFRPDPFDPDPAARMYATGDRAVLRVDGLIDCLGRVDDQVKILGHRVEPDEVRRLVEEHPAVRSAVVVAEGEPRRLVAFVELVTDGPPPTRDDVLRPLRGWLPPAVLPADVFVVPAIPLTVNDKVDPAALATMRGRPLAARPAVPVELLGPERDAARIFTAALTGAGRPAPEALAPDSDFFVLGGHSLLAVSMLAAAERELDRRLPLAGFLAEPTVAGLAGLLANAAPDGDGPAPVASPTGEYPASAVQRRLWFLDRIPHLRGAYLVPTVLEFDGVDIDALAGATALVLGRHPALRSRFRLDPRARAVFYSTDGPPGPVRVTDAAGWSAAVLAEHLAAACWTPFDLARDAPARAELVVTGSRVLLVLTMHHLVVDGWGQAELLSQLATAYRARIGGTTPDLPAAVHPAAIRPAAEQLGEAAVAGLLDAPTDIDLPYDRPRGTGQTTRAATRVTEFDPALTAQLRGTINGLGVTTFMATAALLGAVLARRGTQRDFLFACPWLGRDTAASTHAVAMFVNTLVLRVDLRGEPSWRELLRRVRDSSLAAYRTAAVPFDAVAARLHPDRDLRRPPVTPVYLAALDSPATVPWFGPGVAVGLREPEPMHLKYELELVATDLPDTMRLALTYAVDLFDAPTADDLLAALGRCADDLCTDPDAAVMKENPR